MAKGHKMRASKSSGSHAHKGERMGRGSAQGAGMVSTGGPGKAAMRVTPHMSAASFEGGANAYKPAKMSVNNEE